MSVQKSNMEKFESFELTPENAQKVEGGKKKGKVKTCMTIEVVRCVQVEGGWCPGGYSGDGWEIDSERCPWAKDADVQWYRTISIKMSANQRLEWPAADFTFYNLRYEAS